MLAVGSTSANNYILGTAFMRNFYTQLNLASSSVTFAVSSYAPKNTLLEFAKIKWVWFGIEWYYWLAMVGGGLLIIIGLIVLIFYCCKRKGGKGRSSWSTEESSERSNSSSFSTKGLNLPKPRQNTDMNEAKQIYEDKNYDLKPKS